ncbi:hypothetical protein BC832DRAFT_542699 [Gaertneriomyces semiglobifer]|nr:hypothetical protein BC832DRAFT_542699 [Gaertneriomyces semiglobifer]
MCSSTVSSISLPTRRHSYTSESYAEEASNEKNDMSETTTRTGQIHEACFVQGFAACNDTKFDQSGRGVVFVDNSTRAVAGDIDFVVVLKESVVMKDLFRGTTFCMDNSMREMTLPVGTKIFFELTSEDGIRVNTVRKGKTLTKLEQKAQFYTALKNNQLQPQQSTSIDYTFNSGDIVVFAYNGFDHVSIEQEAKALHLSYPLVPCWISRQDVAAWKAEACLERERAERERERAERERERRELLEEIERLKASQLRS